MRRRMADRAYGHELIIRILHESFPRIADFMRWVIFGGMSEALFSILCSSNFGLFFCRCTLFIFLDFPTVYFAKLLTFQFVILRTFIFGIENRRIFMRWLKPRYCDCLFLCPIEKTIFIIWIDQLVVQYFTC